MAMKAKPIGYMVCYFDPLDGLRSQYGADPETVGALQYSEDNVLVFPDRAQARQAIAISRQVALLARAQGVPENSDFTTDAAKLRIVALFAAPVMAPRKADQA